MNLHFELFELTATERASIRDAISCDEFRAVDNRSDGCADCDALGDARRIGQRIADGFKILNGSE